MVPENGVDSLMVSKLRLIDQAVLFYNATIFIHIIASYKKLPNWPILLGIHILIFIVIWFIIKNDVENQKSFFNWLHIWYPLILLLWFYPETGMLRFTIFPRDLDPEFVLLETALFPQRFYFTVPLMLSVPLLEFLHIIYFSYFFLLFLPALITYRKNRAGVVEYLFVVVISMFVHYWFAIIFPVSGPTALREQVMPPGILFIPIMDFLYSTVDQGGATFPSAYTATALIATAYAFRFFPRLRIFFLLWLFLILISTILCTFHYTIDTIAGIFTGTLLLVGGKQLYGRYNH